MEEYNLYRSYIKNYTPPFAKVDEEQTIKTAGITLVCNNCNFTLGAAPTYPNTYNIRPNGNYPSPIARFVCGVTVDPIHLNSQKVKYLNGQMVDDQEVDVKQSDTIVLLQQQLRNVYINFNTWQSVENPPSAYSWVAKQTLYKLLSRTYAGLPLYTPTSNPSQERVIQQTMEQTSYQLYNRFRNQSNLVVETEAVLPLVELLNLDITRPTLLNAQPVLIESIDYTLPLNKEPITIKAHTLLGKL